jgi:xanthine/uracil/vitamin C permease (AzgA family)
MTLAAGLDSTSVLFMFGVMQILTGLAYRMPMPVQPLKAMAAIVIAQQASAATLYGGGLAIGVVMLLLVITGLLDWLARVIPKCVVRGIQFGLGLQLASVALGKFVQADGLSGYGLAAGAFIITISLLGNRRFPAALPVLLLGFLYALVSHFDPAVLSGIAVRVPVLHIPQPADILTGFLVLALPQIPLSLGNSVLATRQLAEDLFPNRQLTIRKIGLTYALMNLVNPWLGGVPTCHGSGGMAGHFAFGGRTGGSVIIYGLLFVILGLFFGGVFEQVIRVFPIPILGVMLLFESLALIWLIRDTTPSRAEFPIAVLVGLLAFTLPYGYVVGLVVGTALFSLKNRTRLITPDAE